MTTKTKTGKTTKPSHHTVTLWLSDSDHTLLRATVDAANAAAPGMRYNASMIMRALLAGYANGHLALPGLPQVHVVPSAPATPSIPGGVA